MKKASLDSAFFGGKCVEHNLLRWWHVLVLRRLNEIISCILLSGRSASRGRAATYPASASRRRSIVWYHFAGVIGTVSKPAYWRSVTESRNRRCNTAPNGASYASADCQCPTLATFDVMYFDRRAGGKDE